MKPPLFCHIVGLGSVAVMMLGLAPAGSSSSSTGSTTRSALSEENRGRKSIRSYTRLFIGHLKNAHPNASLNSPIGNRNHPQEQTLCPCFSLRDEVFWVYGRGSRLSFIASERVFLQRSKSFVSGEGKTYRLHLRR